MDLVERSNLQNANLTLQLQLKDTKSDMLTAQRRLAASDVHKKRNRSPTALLAPAMISKKIARDTAFIESSIQAPTAQQSTSLRLSQSSSIAVSDDDDEEEQEERPRGGGAGAEDEEAADDGNSFLFEEDTVADIFAEQQLQSQLQHTKTLMSASVSPRHSLANARQQQGAHVQARGPPGA